jgi:hypothetical protein
MILIAFQLIFPSKEISLFLNQINFIFMLHRLWSGFTSTNILSYLLSGYNTLSFFDAVFLILKNARVLISWKGLTL